MPGAFNEYELDFDVITNPNEKLDIDKEAIITTAITEAPIIKFLFLFLSLAI